MSIPCRNCGARNAEGRVRCYLCEQFLGAQSLPEAAPAPTPAKAQVPAPDGGAAPRVPSTAPRDAVDAWTIKSANPTVGWLSPPGLAAAAIAIAAIAIPAILLQNLWQQQQLLRVERERTALLISAARQSPAPPAAPTGAALHFHAPSPTPRLASRPVPSMPAAVVTPAPVVRLASVARLPPVVRLAPVNMKAAATRSARRRTSSHTVRIAALQIAPLHAANTGTFSSPLHHLTGRSPAHVPAASPPAPARIAVHRRPAPLRHLQTAREFQRRGPVLVLWRRRAPARPIFAGGQREARDLVLEGDIARQTADHYYYSGGYTRMAAQLYNRALTCYSQAASLNPRLRGVQGRIRYARSKQGRLQAQTRYASRFSG